MNATIILHLFDRIGKIGILLFLVELVPHRPVTGWEATMLLIFALMYIIGEGKS